MILKSIHKNPKYAHYPSASLHHLAKRKDLLHCSESTWLKYVKEQDLKRPYKRHNLRDYKVGVRAEDINEIWHIDITVIKLSHGKSLYLQTIIDNYSRMCLAWQLNKSKEALNTVELLEKAREFKAKETSLFMDQGSENINEKVSFFLEKNKITRIIAKHDTKYSNSMVEVFFRSLKNNYLYFQNPKSFNDLNKKLLFYIREYNHNIPHRAHNGFTPYEIFSKTPKDELLKQFKEGMIKSFNFRKESYYNLNWA